MTRSVGSILDDDNGSIRQGSDAPRGFLALFIVTFHSLDVAYCEACAIGSPSIAADTGRSARGAAAEQEIVRMKGMTDGR
jgi:hypothetical protein